MRFAPPSGVACGAEIRRQAGKWQLQAATQSEFAALPAEESRRLRLFYDALMTSAKRAAAAGSSPVDFRLKARKRLIGDDLGKEMTLCVRGVQRWE
jgi:hypothetical protein